MFTCMRAISPEGTLIGLVRIAHLKSQYQISAHFRVFPHRAAYNSTFTIVPWPLSIWKNIGGFITALRNKRAKQASR